MVSDGEAESKRERRATVNPSRRIVLLAVLVVLVGCRERSLPHEGKSVVELEAMLRDDDPNVQSQGAFGLSLLGAEARSATPILVERLSSSQPLVRQNAALALGKIGPEAHEAVPALVELLRDPEWTVRRQAATALGEVGSSAREALPALRRMRNDSDPLVRKAAAVSIGKISGK